MSRWFRHYAGMMRDDKLVRASLRCKQSIERVVWVYGAVLESAAEIDDEGRYEVDVAEIAYFLRCKPAAIEAVLSALQELGRVDGLRVTAWSKRQFKSDRSNDRVAAHRASKKQAGNVTPAFQERDGNSPETETETEVSVAKATGEKSPSSADAKFWSDAKAYLADAGVKDPGKMVGKWVRDHGKRETASAVSRAQIERAVEPVGFVQACFREAKRSAEEVPLC